MLFDFFLKKQLGAFTLNAGLQSLSAHIAVVGESGSGKTLTFDMLAGLLKPDEGHIRIGCETWLDGHTDVPPQKRRVGLVFQDYALFPHLTVAQNIAFGLDAGVKNPGRKQSLVMVGRWLEKMGLERVAAHYPHQISGGQKQRAALARALAGQPKLLLLDEPFSALDAGLRAQMRREAAAAAREENVPLILITHDPVDAEELGCEVWRMKGGTLEKG